MKKMLKEPELDYNIDFVLNNKLKNKQRII